MVDYVVDIEEEVFVCVWCFLLYLLFLVYELLLILFCVDNFECCDEVLMNVVLCNCK